MTDTRGYQLADFVRELTEPHTHTEPYTVRERGEWRTHRHITRAPALLAQLWANDVPSSAAEDGQRAGFGSKPAARLDALDTAARIDLEVNRWVTDLGEDAPLDTIAALRKLNGLAASADPVQRREIAGDVRRWWIRARVVTGWDSPAWTPDNTCPQCGERGTLRVRLADHIATCVDDGCRATWDQQTIGLLADHIRAESSAERGPARRPGPCWCPLPMPRVDLTWLCPRCGSARCTHALQARLVGELRAEREQQGA